MNFEKSVSALLSLGRELASPQQAGVQKFGLENISALAQELGQPQRTAPCAHIAGTNGKGSTAAMLESILRTAGFRTGLYTSPHLERINERIRINGENIADGDFAEAWMRVHSSIEGLMASGKLAAHPTFFECVTAMAFVAFARKDVNFAVYEVGLGGRLDATNIVEPAVAILTPIDFDHENYLGHSIEEIASEKAGIIKRHAQVVSATQRPEARAVILKRCTEMDARLIEVDAVTSIEDFHNSKGFYRARAVFPPSAAKMSLAPALPGRFQIGNALTAAAAARLLGDGGFEIDDAAIEKGIAAVKWPGRLEKLAISPDIYLDGAHNPSGARELLQFWKDNYASRRIVLVYGAMRDKAVEEIAGLLFPYADTVILTEPRNPRAVSAPLLAEMTGHHAKKALIVGDPYDALETAIKLANSDDAVCATGSLYLVGDLRTYWRSRAASAVAIPNAASESV
ncbi:MAG: folylpolyglutamate synthase/dihydrofolate synthase family protein [Candidatus Acidiferrales bacterium]